MSRRSATSLAGVGWAVLAVLVGLDVVADGPLRRHLDPAVEHWVSRHDHGAVRVLAEVLLQAGQRYVLVLPLVALAVLVCRRQRRVRPAVTGAGVLVVLGVLVWLVKQLIGRSAPASGHDVLFAGGASFPSGHAINGVVLWTLALTYRAVWVPWLTRRRRLVVAAVLGVAAGLGTTGMGYHWATDVLAGWAIGALGALLVLAVDPARAPAVPAAPPDRPPALVVDRS